MRVRCILKEGESLLALLKRFNQRVQKSGLLREVTKNRYRGKPQSELNVWRSKIYRLKIKKFVEEKIKEGWPLEKALDMARRYHNYIKLDRT